MCIDHREYLDSVPVGVVLLLKNRIVYIVKRDASVEAGIDGIFLERFVVVFHAF